MATRGATSPTECAPHLCSGRQCRDNHTQLLNKDDFADFEKALAPPEAKVGGVVTMGPMSFLPSTITIDAGDEVIRKNTSSYYHNVVDDPRKTLYRVNVSSPSGSAPFASLLLQPGTSFYNVFDKPGTYHYVCVVHESSGMNGTVIVRPRLLLASGKK